MKSKQHHTSHLIEKQRVSANTKNNAVAERTLEWEHRGKRGKAGSNINVC